MNYRKIYKEYYGIDFDESFDIHHLDFDRKNNDISNLLLLPKDLHKKYHSLLQELDFSNWKSGKIEVTTRIDLRNFDLFTDVVLIDFLDTVKECEKWLLYKMNLELLKQNNEVKTNG